MSKFKFQLFHDGKPGNRYFATLEAAEAEARKLNADPRRAKYSWWGEASAGPRVEKQKPSLRAPKIEPSIGSGPLAILKRDQEAAQRLVHGVGQKRTLELLQRAQKQLDQRLHRAEGLSGPGKGSFTAVQLRATLMQIRAVTAQLQVGMKGVVLSQGKAAAEQAAVAAAKYLRTAEAKFRGSSQRLSLDTARLIDRAQAGTESSLLRRLMSDPDHPARGGILQRYGESVVSHFEDVLQDRLVARTPWDEVRARLTEGSPFLKDAPASWSERIVRTETMYAQNKSGHEAIVQANDELGDMVKVISCTFDDRTGADSYAVHGQIRRPSESFQSWYGSFMHPPDRPNDRGIVVPHRISWPIPAELKPKSPGDVAARWRQEGRKGSPPAQPRVSTVPLDQFGKAPEKKVENPGSQEPA